MPNTHTTQKLKKGTPVTTAGGYTAKVVGPDPKDSERVIIKYTGLQAWLGEDSYHPSQLRIEGLPPETKPATNTPRRRNKKAAESLTIYKPASDPETIEQGLREGWIQPVSKKVDLKVGDLLETSDGYLGLIEAWDRDGYTVALSNGKYLTGTNAELRRWGYKKLWSEGDRITPKHNPGSRHGVIVGFNIKNKKTPLLIRFDGSQTDGKWGKDAVILADDNIQPAINETAPESIKTEEVKATRDRAATEDPGNCAEPAGSNHRRSRHKSRRKARDRQEVSVSPIGATEDQESGCQGPAPVGTDRRIEVARSQVADIRNTGWIETADGEMLNPLHYTVIDDLNTTEGIQAAIAAIQKEGPIMPTGCWIEAYTATRKTKTGDTRQYTYYRVKAYEPMFEAEDGTLKRSKNLGDVNSEAYQDWCQRRERRERINQLQKQLIQLEKSKPPPEKTLIYESTPAWFDETLDKWRWEDIPEGYERAEMYRHYRKAS